MYSRRGLCGQRPAAVALRLLRGECIEQRDGEHDPQRDRHALAPPAILCGDSEQGEVHGISRDASPESAGRAWLGENADPGQHLAGAERAKERVVVAHTELPPEPSWCDDLREPEADADHTERACHLLVRHAPSPPARVRSRAVLRAQPTCPHRRMCTSTRTCTMLVPRAAAVERCIGRLVA